MSEPVAPLCPYCGKNAVLEDNIKIYKTRSYGLSWICPNYPTCDTYVGAHSKTHEPYGSMANEELRTWRGRAHAAFDPLWRGRRAKMDRKAAYGLMQSLMDLPESQAHIGKFSLQQCKDLIGLLDKWREAQ